MEKRIIFRGWLLPICLVATQLIISIIFFFYPAAQTVWQSLFIPDPFGLSVQYVGLGNFEDLFSNNYFGASYITTAIFSILLTFCSMILALFLAVCTDRVIKSSGIYRTLLIWLYAVAPASGFSLNLYDKYKSRHSLKVS